jgi:hypothetical protein
MDRGSGERRRETSRLPMQDGSGTRWTHGTVVDDSRLTHNPEVAGSNPAPATSFRRSRPFPSRERAFCVSSTVARRVAEAALRAAWRRDGGDGVARDETAWTWWTLPPAIAGCLAQRYASASRSLPRRSADTGWPTSTRTPLRSHLGCGCTPGRPGAGAGAAQVGRVEDDRDGWCVLVVGGGDLDGLAVHVARLGFEAEVREPPELREAAALLARRLVAMAGTG